MIILNNKNLSGFIYDLQFCPLKLTFKLNGIPVFRKSFLESFSNDNFTIADPGKEWNCCCDQNRIHPNRQLICQGNKENLFVISYLTGGIGTIQHLALIKYRNERIIDFWVEIVQGDLDNKAGIIEALKKHKDQAWVSNNRISI